MVLHSDSIPLVLPSTELLLCLWTYWPHQYCSTFPFELDEYGRYTLIVRETEDYPAADEVEVRIECVWIIELNADRHLGHGNGGNLRAFA